MSKLRSLLLSLCLAFGASHANANGLPDAANTLVNEYFAALQVGDIGALSRMMDERMLRSLSGALSHPDYAAQLAKDNSARSFTVTGGRMTSGGILEVDFEASDSMETIKKRLYLVADRRVRGNYLILEEQVVP